MDQFISEFLSYCVDEMSSIGFSDEEIVAFLRFCIHVYLDRMNPVS